MKRILPALGLGVCVLISSCSSPGSLPSVTASDRDTAVTALASAQNTAFYGGAGWTYSAPGNTMTASGPNASVIIFFSPSYTAFANLSNGSSARMTLTLTSYHDPGTAYSISGTLTCVMTCDSLGLAAISYQGTFTLSGGNVRTMTLNSTLNLNTYAYSGSVTVNGQTFVY
jgi:hypothetical protein